MNSMSTELANQNGFDLLKTIARDGWSEQLTEEFLDKYDEAIAHRIILSLKQLRLINYRIDPKKVKSILPDKVLEVHQNTWSDLWRLLIGNLVKKYVNAVDEGRVRQPFLAYLKGVIDHLVISNARSLRVVPRTSLLTSLRNLCKAKKEATQRSYISELKFAQWAVVKSALLSQCPDNITNEVDRNQQHVIDYFFERFLLSQCQRIRKARGPRVLDELLSAFGTADYRRGLDFVGNVPQYTGGETPIRFPHWDGQSEEDEFLSLLASRKPGGRNEKSDLELREIRMVYWDRLYRDDPASVEELDRELLAVTREGSLDDCIAFVELRAFTRLWFSGRRAMKRNQKATLTYEFSNAGSHVQTEGQRPVDIRNASLYDIRGLHMSWHESAKAAGGNPKDFSARKRFLKHLKEECDRNWVEVFGDSKESPFKAATDGTR